MPRTPSGLILPTNRPPAATAGTTQRRTAPAHSKVPPFLADHQASKIRGLSGGSFPRISLFLQELLCLLMNGTEAATAFPSAL